MSPITFHKAKRLQYLLSHAIAPLPRPWRTALAKLFHKVVAVPPRTMRPQGDMVAGLQALIAHVQSALGRNAVMVEVGSYAGESTVMFAKGFAKVTAVDPWIGMANVEAAFDSRVRQFANVEKRKMMSDQAAASIPNSSLDFVYIDADHSYEFVHSDIQLWLPKIRQGGVIGGHDYGAESPGVVRAVEELLGKPDATFADASWLKIL